MGFNRNHNRVGLLACVAGILVFARFLFHEGALQWLFHAVKPLMAALIIIYLLQPIVNWLSQNLHLPRALAVLISYCLLLAILAFVVGTLIPAIVTNVADILPKDYTALLDRIAAIPWIRNVIRSRAASEFDTEYSGAAKPVCIALDEILYQPPRIGGRLL